MNDENWKEEYKNWKALNHYQLKLLDQAPNSLSQTWLLNQMWCDWNEMKKIREAELPKVHQVKTTSLADPWLD